LRTKAESSTTASRSGLGKLAWHLGDRRC
jgi:hypothetical protein